MGKLREAGLSIPRIEIAAAYMPVVRGFLIATACYYALISISHPFYEVGANLWKLDGLAVVSTIWTFGWWRRLKRAPLSLHRLELASATTNALFLANVLAYQLIHFEPFKLVYFILMALVFGTSAPSRRVAYLSVGASITALIFMARSVPGDLIQQYAFPGLAATFAAIGMCTLMRGAVLRELGARLASDALNAALQEKLIENDRLRAEAQAANRAKTEFLGTISHEIRTPLNGVLGMAQIMALDDLSETQRTRLGVVSASGRALLTVVNDVLDISRIETGRMEIAAAPFDLGGFGEAMGRLYAGLAEERGLEFRLDIEPQMRGWRMGDEVRLRQVLGNLISNALKFTEAGAVTVAIGGDDQRLAISVTDTGIGIAPEWRSKVFSKFLQVDGSSTRRVGGSGLGLAICKDLLELMGGEVYFETELGIGSRFSFHLPCPKVEGPAQVAASAAPEPNPDMRILIVDDNATNRVVVQTLLGHLGVITATACDGAEAVAAWESARWDVILMDIHMPQMDGLEASRTIRAREQARGLTRTPIIAVTASVLSHENASYLNAGMDGVVAKPVEAQTLISTIQACLAAETPAAVAAGAPPRLAAGSSRG
jgi:signal transduction histidine kinase/ActR/RegA family two-component response regulator